MFATLRSVLVAHFRVSLSAEAVHAIVVLREGEHASEAEIIEHCRERIAGYKVPRSVDFKAESLPVSGAGKVLKNELRAPFWESNGKQVN